MSTFQIKTLGCKVNSFDSNAIHTQLTELGWTATVIDPDLYVINSCTVTENSNKQSRYEARRIRRKFPEVKVAITGCYAQTDSASLALEESIDFVVPNEIKHEIGQLIEQAWKTPPAKKILGDVLAVKDNRQGHFKSSVTLFEKAKTENARAFVKIQDGCNGFCTYCIIPYARGASRSVHPELILTEIKRLVDTDFKEIVLTGIHLGDYGEDLSETDRPTGSYDHPIANLMDQISLIIRGHSRLRISSLEPAEISGELLESLNENKDVVCQHFHLPLQSGDSEILKKMRRSYTKDEYKAGIESIRKIFPDACIGADVIPGFPGETAEQHQSTIDFIADCGINYLHVFPYSVRNNTAAKRMPDHLNPRVVKERSEELRGLSKVRWQQFQKKYHSQEVEVVWENKIQENGSLRGVTREYLNVQSKMSQTHQPGTISISSVLGSTQDQHLLVR